MCEQCAGMSDEQYSQQIERNIRTYGWTVQYVEGEGDRNPGFGYTVGLSLCRHPEFIVFDADPAWVYLVLKPLASAVLEGSMFDEGDDLAAFFPQSESPQLLRFPDSATHLYTANQMFRGPADDPLPALQLVWPTRTALMQPSDQLPTAQDGVR